MKKKLMAAAVAGVFAVSSLGGCGIIPAKKEATTESVAGAVIGGGGAYALAGAASPAWRAVSTAAGIVLGWIVGQKVADENKK